MSLNLSAKYYQEITERPQKMSTKNIKTFPKKKKKISRYMIDKFPPEI